MGLPRCTRRRRCVCRCGCCKDFCNRWGFIPLWVGLGILLLVFCPFQMFLLLVAILLVVLGVSVLRC